MTYDKSLFTLCERVYMYQGYPAKRALSAMRKGGPFWQDTIDIRKSLTSTNLSQIYHIIAS